MAAGEFLRLRRMGMAPGGSFLVLIVMMMVMAMIVRVPVRVCVCVMIMGARAQ